jgi:hypothetical protein
MHSTVAVGTGFVFGSLASSPRAGGHRSAVHSNSFNRACQPSMRQRVLIRVIQQPPVFAWTLYKSSGHLCLFLQFNKDGPLYSVSVVVVRS